MDLRVTVGSLAAWRAGVAALALAALALGLLSLAPRAEAAFPGQNGLIAFERVMPSASTSTTDIFTMPPEGAPQLDVTPDPASDGEPAFSPDGSSIAFVTSRDGNDEIYVVNADGIGGLRRLTSTPGAGTSVIDESPAFSRDGKRIFFVSPRAGNNRDIYAMDVADTNSDDNGDNVTRLTASPESESDPVASPDGTKIVFNRGPHVYLMGVDGANPTKLVEGAFNPDFSPDGKVVVFMKGNDIQTIELEGTPTVKQLTSDGTTVNDHHPAFSPDGSKIAFVKTTPIGSSPVGGIYTMNANGTGQAGLTTAPFNPDTNPNWGITPASADKSPPDTTITSGPTGTTNDATPTFEFSSSESGSSFECRVDSAPFAPCSSAHTTAPLADGQHTFEVRATDLAGNQDASPASRGFTVSAGAPNDTTPPQTTIGSGPSGAINDRTPSFEFSSDEADSSFECRIDAAPFASCTSPHTTTELPDGQHTFEVRATDEAANADPTPAARTFTIDTDPPQTTITSGPSGPVADPTPAFEFTSDEQGSSFECRVDSAPFDSCSSPHTTAPLADGGHTFAVRATDALGNVDQVPATRNFIVETTATPHGIGGWFGPTATPPINSMNAVLLTGPVCRGGSPPAYCGRVLTAGGRADRDATSSSALYDPKSETWASCGGGAGCPTPLRPGNLNTARGSATMTVLDGPECRVGSPPGYCGKVLLVGGLNPQFAGLASAELYNPATGTWSSCNSAETASSSCPAPYPDPDAGVWDHTATLLSDGRVLVAGGNFRIDLPVSTQGRRQFTVYDPATGAWSAFGLLYNARQRHTATLLEGTAEQCGQNCGKVLIVGGAGSSATSELYDPASNSSVGVENLDVARRKGHSATLLPSGKVQVAGADVTCGPGSTCSKPLKETEVFDPLTTLWSAGTPLKVPRSGHAAALLPNRRVLAVAGATRLPDEGATENPKPLSAEIYDTQASTWTLTGEPSGVQAPRGPGYDTYLGALTLASGPYSACGKNCGKVLLRAAAGEPAVPGAELFTPTPEVARLSPASGPSTGGTAVTLEGTGLASVSSVKFGGVEATGLTPDPASPDAKLVAISPSGSAGTVPVTVVTDGGTSASGSNTGFTYAAAGGGGTGGGGSTGGGGTALPITTPTPLPPQGGADAAAAALAAERRRLRALRGCLSSARRHTRRESRRARSGSARSRTLARRHARRHARALRARCLRRHGRTPGRVTGLSARTPARKEIVLTFRAPGTDRGKLPPARGYLVKQSIRPITGVRSFRRAQSLCNGTCRFRVTRVGEEVKLRVTDLPPHTTYHYALAARDNVSGRLGPRSRTVSVRTR